MTQGSAFGDLEAVAAEIEAEIGWRVDELRELRNNLLGDQQLVDWPVSSMRTLMVLHYAHLEGFTRHVLGIYVRRINARRIVTRGAKDEIAATSLATQFREFRQGHQTTDGSEEGKRLRLAKREVAFFQRTLEIADGVLELDEEAAVAFEMNLGKDVLLRALYRLGLDPDAIDQKHYGRLDFVKNARNEIAHGGRSTTVSPKTCEAQLQATVDFMGELARLVRSALRSEAYLADSSRWPYAALEAR